MSNTPTGSDPAANSRGVSGQFDPVFSEQRVAYDVRGLDEADLAADPLTQFRRWYDDALAGRVLEPNAMTLATADAAGAPSARMVLLKNVDPRGFTFFTNFTSRKGTELAVNPAAALVFGWIAQHRQVSVRGRTERLPAAETAEYFGSRPWGSRIGAWASRQSEPGSREELDQRWARLAARWPDRGRPDDVPVPDHWGGFVLRPVEVEFWQGRQSRMHDRLVFVARAPAPSLDDAEAWRVERRNP